MKTTESPAIVLPLLLKLVLLLRKKKTEENVLQGLLSFLRVC